MWIANRKKKKKRKIASEICNGAIKVSRYQEDVQRKHSCAKLLVITRHTKIGKEFVSRKSKFRKLRSTNRSIHKVRHKPVNEANIFNISHSSSISISVSHSSLCSLNRQTRIALSNSASNDRSVAEAIATVLAVTLDHRSRFENVNRVAVVEKAMKVLSKKNSTKAVRRAALLCCAKQLREFIDEYCLH